MHYTKGSAAELATGTYQVLTERQYSTELAHARKMRGTHHGWWQIPLAERQAGWENLISPPFFRMHIDSITGLRASTQVSPNAAKRSW